VKIDGSLSGGIQAFHRAEEKMSDAANAIVKATTDREASASDFVKPLVSMQEAEIQAKAAARLIEAEDEMIGSILNVDA